MDFEGGDRTGVVEYGVVALGADGVGEAWTGLCAPAAEIPARDADTHGLTGRDLAGSEPFAARWDLFRDLRRQGPFLAHSADVEDRFLRRQWRTPGEVPDWSDPPAAGADWGPWLDSRGLARAVRPRESAALGDLIDAWELGPELAECAERHCPPARRRRHAALFDALACALAFRVVLEARPDWGLRRVFRESRGGSEISEQAWFF